MNTSSQHNENSGSSFSYERALPVSNGKLGMMLFISTEVMLFTALMASYVVLRYSGLQNWPTANQVGLNPVVGAANTVLLMLSGITMWWSVRQCGQDRPTSAKTWLFVTFVLGLAFLGVKAFEYKAKYDHGIFPSRDKSLLYDVADDNYLSRAVSEMRTEIRRVEQLAADGKLEQKQKRLDDLYLLQSGIVNWTQFVAGRSGDPADKRAAVLALAHQIYHWDENPDVNKYIAAEQVQVEAEKSRLNREITRFNAERSDAQEKLRELLPKKDSGDESTKQEYDRVAREVSRLTEDIANLNKEIRPFENRLLAIKRVNAGKGINETYDVRLPVVIPGGHKWSSLYYLLTGAHAVHLVAGLLPMIWLLCCRLSVRRLGVMENLSLYWHFVDVVWLVMFAVIYLT